MRFTSDAPTDDGLPAGPVPGEDPGRRTDDNRESGLSNGSRDARSIRFSGAHSTGRH
jgi:hypothetical protein